MIDILIPLYNNEKYIGKCISKLKKQTFTDYKVYILDDGSKDNSFKAAESAINNDSRFHLITRENRGVSCTRQELIDISSQEYIMFIDSDDYLYSENTLELMMNKIIEKQSDILISAIVKMIDGEENRNRITDGSSLTVNTKQALEDLFYIKYNGPSLVASIFKRKVFKNTHFIPGIIYEDADIFYKLVMNADTVTYFNIPSYVYTIKQDSIMRTAIDKKNLVLIHISRRIVSEIREKYPELENAAIYSLNNNCLELLRLKVLSNNKFEDNGIIRSEIKKAKKIVINDPNARKGKIIQTKAAAAGEWCFKLLMIIYVKILHKI